MVALTLQCCVCRRLWRYVLWLNCASYSKSYYWQPIGSRIWEIDWYQNGWPWPLFIVRLRSCQPLRHIRHWISRKPLEIEPNTLRGQYLENSWRCYLATIANCQILCCDALRSAILATAWLLVIISNRVGLSTKSSHCTIDVGFLNVAEYSGFTQFPAATL